MKEIYLKHLDELHHFRDPPFKKKYEGRMAELISSIKENGVITPIITFINEDGQLEIISGNRVVEACRELGMDTVPVVVNEMTRDEATVSYISVNLMTRDEIPPSEKARAYKMLRDAYAHQGKKLLDDSDLKNTGDKLSELLHESHDQICRYIRLTNLIPEMLELVDEGKLALRTAVELSYLSTKFQKVIFDYYTYDEVIPSYAQANKIRKLDKDSKLDEDDIMNIICEKNPNQKVSSYNLSDDFCKRYFPKCTSGTEIEEMIAMLFEKLRKYESAEKRKERAI